MLMVRDFVAFAAQDWSMVADDFLVNEFFGIDGQRDRNIRNWQPSFATLATYKKSWLEQAAQTAASADMAMLVADLLVATNLDQIDIAGRFCCCSQAL